MKIFKGFILFLSVIFVGIISSCVSLQNSGNSTIPNLVIELTPMHFSKFLKDKFPLKKDLKVGTLLLKNPNVLSIDQNNKLEMKTDLLFDSFVDVNGKVDIAGNIMFDKEKKAFYLQNPEIKEVTVFDKTIAPPSLINPALNSLINSFFREVPIYQLNEGYQKYLIKDVKVENGKIKLILGF